MTPQEHADVWKEAARVVGGMDTMQAELRRAMSQQNIGPAGNDGWSTRCYSESEMNANRAYSAAANVLLQIAAIYEAKAKEATLTVDDLEK